MRDIERVIAGDYCIGCGACAAIADAPVAMKWNKVGQIRATIIDEIPPAVGDLMDRVCPFSNDGPHENELSEPLKPENSAYDDKLGAYSATFAGHVEEGSFREHASSGGYATWIATELLTTGAVDFIIHVRPAPGSETMFAYAISGSVDEVRARSKTRYFPVEMSAVLTEARQRGGRFGIVGVPCFIKAANRLAEIDPALKSQMAYRIAIICGHHKSARFGESLAWQMGVRPGKAKMVDFRRKLPNRPANKYGFAALAKEQSVEAVSPMASLIGASWALGAFRAKACDYCDDVVGETADVSIGDAWLPAYIREDAGANVIVIRNPTIARITDAARRDGRLSLDELPRSEVVRSQSSGFRHRREGLAYRLWLQDRAKVWRPKKRVHPSGKLAASQKRIFRLRMLSSKVSHRSYEVARQTGMLSLYTLSFKFMGLLLKVAQKLARK